MSLLGPLQGAPEDVFQASRPTTQDTTFSRLQGSDRVNRHISRKCLTWEATVFDRVISIDWSGAGTETDRADLRVVEAGFHDGRATIVNPTVVGARAGTKRWTREECRRYLAQTLGEQRGRCLVAMDFGFGYPWGTDRAVFHCEGWREMIGVIATIYDAEERATSTAEEINAGVRGPGPYRLGRDRTSFRFYLDERVSYYRLVETAVSQAISQWFLGAGPKVASSTITGMAALDYLMTRRKQKKIDFQVWPQEGLLPEGDKHIIVESYPAIYCEPPDYGECKDEHCQDAWRVLQWMLRKANTGTLERYFQIASVPFGRVADVSFKEQVRFEGWILGVSSPADS